MTNKRTGNGRQAKAKQMQMRGFFASLRMIDKKAGMTSVFFVISGCWSKLPVCWWKLFDGEFGVVAVAGDDGVLVGVTLFVLHAEGVAFVVDEGDFDLAVAAV